MLKSFPYGPITSAITILAVIGACALIETVAAQSAKIILNEGACTIDLLDGSEVSIITDSGDPNLGDLKAFTLNPDFCSTISSTASVTVSPLNPPAEVEQGGRFSVSLSSLGARQCRRTGLVGTNWPSDWISPPPSGDFPVDIPSGFTSGSKTFTFECRNGDIVEYADAQITVTEADLLTCTDLNPGWSRDNAILAGSLEITETWQDVFGDLVSFPIGNWQNIAVESNKFGALAFDTNGIQANEDGRITSQEIQGLGIKFGATLVSISPCQGDFRIDVLGACLQEIPTIGGAFRWSTDPADSLSHCILPDANPLYLNIAYGQILTNSDGSQRVSWRCTTSQTSVEECGSRIEPF